MSFDSVYVTRYMGAKYKLLDFIVPPLTEVVAQGSSVVDLMAGTHSIGYALKQRNIVYANDIQAYSFAFGKALLQNGNRTGVADVFHEYFEDFEIRERSQGWFSSTYGDTYFSFDQCREIEEVRTRIDLVHDLTARNLLLVALANAMSLCQSSPGHFAQYMPADHPRLSVLRNMSVFEAFKRRCVELRVTTSEFDHQVFNLDVFEFLKMLEETGGVAKGSLAYLDPPYTSAQYSRYYHLLETVVLQDNPPVSFKGLYRHDRHQSPFCSSRSAVQAFRRLFRKVSEQEWSLAVSYSSHGLVSLEILRDLLKENFKNVQMHRRPHVHSMQGRGMVNDRTEILLVAT